MHGALGSKTTLLPELTEATRLSVAPIHSPSEAADTLIVHPSPSAESIPLWVTPETLWANPWDRDPLEGAALFLGRRAAPAPSQSPEATADGALPNSGSETAPQGAVGRTDAAPSSAMPMVWHADGLTTSHQAVLEGLASPRHAGTVVSVSLPGQDPPRITVNPYRCDSEHWENDWIETVTVPANDPAGVDSVYEPYFEKKYTLIAKNDVTIDDTGLSSDSADAEYYDFAATPPQDAGVQLGVGGVEFVNPPTGHWGDYRSDHVYYRHVLGQDLKVHLAFQDSVGEGLYTDNSGEFEVEIWCGWLTIPEPPGGCENDALVETAKGNKGGAPNSFSPGQVQYLLGMPRLTSSDLHSGGFGTSCGVTRSWASHPAVRPDGFAGAGVVINQLPFVVKYDADPTNPPVGVVTNATTGRNFDWTGSAYAPRLYNQETLTHDYSTAKEFVLTDTTGNKVRFHNFHSDLPAYQRGQFKSFTDAYGFVTTADRGTDGKVTEVWRQTGTGAATVRDSYVYTYYGATGGAVRGMLQKVTLRRGIGSPLVYTTVREVEYQYHTRTPAGAYFGPTGTLKLAQVKDPAGAVIDNEYYRYWKPGDTDFTTKGYVGGVKYVVRSAAYGRMLQAGLDPLTASDSTVAPYADSYFEYDDAHRVTKEKVWGAGCSSGTGCSEGLGEFTFSYTVTHRAGYEDGPNSWKYKTIETRPDGVVNTVFGNFAGQVMLSEIYNPAVSTADRWVNFYKYDDNSRLLWHAHPSAIQKDGLGKYYNDTNADLMGEVSGNYTYVYDAQGLIEVTDYYASTSGTISETVAGGVAGYLANTWLRRGDTGTDVKQGTTEYYKRTAGSVNVFPVAKETRYRNTDGTGGQTTTRSYSWFSGTTEVESGTVTQPTVTTAQNGPNVATSLVTFHDSFGRPIWVKDADGFITYTEYDWVTGSVTKIIADVDTTVTTNEPSGWTTGTGGGLHLTTQYQVDALGRTTKVTAPNGNITHTVYLDAATDEVQVVVLTGTPNGGTFTLTFRSQTTSAIAYNATPAAVELALTALSTVGTGNVSVTAATGGGWQVRFRNILGGQDVPALTGSGSGLTGSGTLGVQVTTATAGGGPADQVRTYPGWDTTSTGCSTSAPCTTGPIEVARENRFHSYREALTLAVTPAVSGTNPTGQEAITLSAIKTLSRTHTNKGGQIIKQDRYYDLTTGLTAYTEDASFGTLDTNFSRTTQDYGKGGRQHRSVTATGTITRTVFDGQGRTASSWVGTNDAGATDADPTGGGATGNNMVKVSDNVYDGATATPGTGRVGDGNLTQQTQYPGGGATNRVTQHFYDWRNRSVATKSGVQTSETDTTVQRPLTYTTYDNLGQATAQESFDGDGVSPQDSSGVPIISSTYNPDRRRALTESLYDEQGRVYRTYVYNINQSNGTIITFGSSVQSRLQSDTWYNKRGQVLKTAQPGGLVQKTTYDGAGRTLKSYTTDGGGDPAPGATSNWDHGDDVTGDSVLSQAEPTYDSSGNVLKTTVRERFHDETATGELVNPTTAPKARVSYMGSYYDMADRLTHSVNVGTYAGSAWTRPSTPPARDNVTLVTSQTYNTAGWVENVTDPRGIVRRTEHDRAGRTLKTIENYVDGTPSATDDRTTEYTYDGSDHMLTLKAALPSSGQQTTLYLYGTTTTDGSDLNTNEVLGGVVHPDKTSGEPSLDPTQAELYLYNAVGQPKKAHYDRNGTFHEFKFDVIGRMTEDQITLLGTNVDGAVRRLATAYDTAGRPYLFTSTSTATGGSVVNEVRRDYNGLGQLITEYQSHSGAVNTGTTPKVQYATSEANNGSNEYVNHSRLKSLTYPDGRVVNYGYGTSGGLDDTVSRLAALTNGGTTYEQYTYLGQSTVVKRGRLQGSNEIGLTYVKQSGESNGDAGDQYTGLDRFGRVVDQRWIKDNDVSNPLDRFQYGYDRNGNRLYRDNLIDNNFDELYHANGASNGYDSFNQLKEFRRGPLSDASDPADGIPDTVTTASYSQAWSLDIQGNWDNITTNSSTQTREHNKQNQVTSVSSQTSPVYDNNGAMTTDQTDKRLKYDAWGRLVEVKSAGGSSVIVSYTYDALNRRVTETAGSTTKDFYYSEQWLLLEERQGSAVKVQYVWSPVYVDALILRDRDTGGDPDLDERLYVQQDANWNVTAVTTPGGTVQERYIYEPYGTPTRLTASWGTAGTDSINWLYLHQGGRYEAATGLYHFRHREYSSALGRWTRQDPEGLRVDTNLYRYESNAPTVFTDPSGLIGIFLGGAGQRASDPNATIFHLSAQYDGPVVTVETPGPLTRAVNARGDAAGLAGMVRDYRRDVNPCEPVDIFGYSRGGVYGFLVAMLLGNPAVVPVRFLGLIDPIRTNIQDRPTNAQYVVPANVTRFWQGIKDPAGDPLSFVDNDPVRGSPSQTYAWGALRLPLIQPPEPVRTVRHHQAMGNVLRGQVVWVRLKVEAAAAGVRWRAP